VHHAAFLFPSVHVCSLSLFAWLQEQLGSRLRHGRIGTAAGAAVDTAVTNGTAARAAAGATGSHTVQMPSCWLFWLLWLRLLLWFWLPGECRPLARSAARLGQQHGCWCRRGVAVGLFYASPSRGCNSDRPTRTTWKRSDAALGCLKRL
jgi:hypothetical protein